MIPQRITADEDVRNVPVAQDSRDSGDTASLTEMRVDNHQVWPAPNDGGNSVSLRRFYRADLMAHRDEQIRV